MTDHAYAHSPNTGRTWHDLDAHLLGTAARAREFTAAFEAGDLGYCLGLWHDIGKLDPAFQRYLELCSREPDRRHPSPDHKAAGCAVAMRHLPVLAMALRGHHGGLPARARMQSWLAEKGTLPGAVAALAAAERLIDGLEPSEPLPFPPELRTDALALELFVRMLASALVDADFLDTEAHFDSGRAVARAGAPDGPEAMQALFERLDRDQRSHVLGSLANDVGQARDAIYEACVVAASQARGVFRLSVPTGGGKTRSGMAFALRHAALHGMRRVVVAVPFISITEQTAGTYRAIFQGEDEAGPTVLEHHSGVDEAGRDDVAGEGDFRPAHQWQRLAAENWDAPIVVTTAVQLFESLFSRRTSRIRKLHRLAGSVIVLDEAQALPHRVLEPALDALRELVARYGASVVLSTATQPAFEEIAPFRAVHAGEIVPDPGRYFAALDRVRYEWRLDPRPRWAEVAEWLAGERQALAIVNTKRDAVALLDALQALGVANVLHLSTLLCGTHRRDVLTDVRARLERDERCILVSTQVVEAGVDLDFPAVYRAVGPLDAIVQAAGRCNRHGTLGPQGGRVTVFDPAEAGRLPRGYDTAVDEARAALARGAERPDDPDVLRTYFTLLYQGVPLGEDVQALRKRLDYPAVDEAFHVIEDDATPVVVSYGSAAEQRRVERALAHLAEPRDGAGRGPRWAWRAIQPYVVNLYRHQARTQAGVIEPVMDGLGRWRGGYDPELRGLLLDGPDPDALVV